MRIISSFRDYYDIVQSEGQDQTRVYNRTLKEVILKSPFPFSYNLNYQRKMYQKMYVIGFCDKIYLVFNLRKDDVCKDISKNCYHLNDVENFIEENFNHKQIEDWKRTDKKKYQKNFWDSDKLRCSFESNFKKWEEFKRSFDAKSLFQEFPIFVADLTHKREYNNFWHQKEENIKITYNDCLNDFDFYRIFDSYQAFQELTMWINNKAVPMKEIPKIKDEIMLEVKGFDKFSFRKEKSKK